MSQPNHLPNKTCKVTSKSLVDVSQAVVNLDQHVIAVCPETGELQMNVNSSRENPTSPNYTSQSIIVVCPKTGEVRQKIITHNSQESTLRNNTLVLNKLRSHTVVNLDSPVIAVCPETGEVQRRAISDNKSQHYGSNARETYSDSDVLMESDSSSIGDSSEYEQINSDIETVHKSCVELVTDIQASTTGLPPKMLCTTCGESFRCADMFQRHKCIDLSKKTSCQLCDYEYQTNKQYHIHLKKHIDTDSLQCPLCKKDFKKRPYLLVHLRSHSKHRLYECPHCDKEFIHFNQFKFHEHVHTGVKPYECRFCDKMFARLSDRKRHEDTHTCDNPGRELHISKERQRAVKQHRCKLCGKTFTLLKKLQLHEKIHVATETFTCTYCARIFPSHNELICHEASHVNNTKPYNCAYCDKSFKQRSHLTDHERIHTGVKPYKCTLCDKAFVQRSQLKYHENSHLGVRPYQCTQCRKSYTQHAHLRNHERIHAGVKVYKCRHCLKAFTRYGSLKAHEKLHKHNETSNLTESLSQKLHLTVKQLTEEQNSSPQSHHELACTQTRKSDFEVRKFAEEKNTLVNAHISNQEISERQDLLEKQHRPQEREVCQKQNSSRNSPQDCKISQPEHTQPYIPGHESIYLNAKEIMNETSYVNNTLHKPNNYLTDKITQHKEYRQEVLLSSEGFKSEHTYADDERCNQTHDHAQEIVQTISEPSPKSCLSTVSVSEDEVELQDCREFSQCSGVAHEQTVEDVDGDSQNGNHVAPSSLQNQSLNEYHETSQEQGGANVYSSVANNNECNKVDNSNKQTVCSNTSDQKRKGRKKSIPCEATVSEPLITRPYKCSFCSKAFIQRSHLRDHEYIHKGVKPFKCGFCEKTFTQSGNLKTHERIHTGSKPFACVHCDKAFIQRNHLREHVKVHFEAKLRTPYKNI